MCFVPCGRLGRSRMNSDMQLRLSTAVCEYYISIYYFFNIQLIRLIFISSTFLYYINIVFLLSHTRT